MIEFKNVCFSYAADPVLNNLSFKLSDGNNLLITGPSGCGKTTVARLILGLERPDSGTVTAPEKISAVFQEDRLIDKLNIIKNINLPLKKEEAAVAERLLYEFGLSDVKYKSVKELSGGMKRRIAIIRALAFSGDMLLMDEPFNGIDSDNIRLISDIINREFTNNGKSVVIISHNADDAQYFGADILHLSFPRRRRSSLPPLP